MIDKLTLALMGIPSPEAPAPATPPTQPPAVRAAACPCACDGCPCKRSAPPRVVREVPPPAPRAADVPPYSVWVSNEGRWGLGWVLTDGTFRAAPGDAGPVARPAYAAPVQGCRIVNGRKVCPR